jgi:chemotaxis family two-component system sensor kinase Cph1
VDSPAFGQADLSNCERELIHLAGSVQPHGVLLLLSAGNLVVLQASRNCAAVLGQTAEALLEEPLSALDAGLAQQVLNLLPDWAGEPLPLLTQVNVAGKPSLLEGTVHLAPGGGVALELEPLEATGGAPAAMELDTVTLQEHIARSVQRYTAAASTGALADAIVQSVRDLTGYDRVMVYRFDPDGHGKIVAEARDPRLESLLGHHYPASDIPQRARELYLKNRVRMLVDVNYEPQALVPPLRPDTGEPLDMSLVPPAQHVAAAPAVPAQHGRHRHAGGLSGARRQALGADRRPPLQPAPPAPGAARCRGPAGRGGFHTHRRDRELRPCAGRADGAAA